MRGAKLSLCLGVVGMLAGVSGSWAQTAPATTPKSAVQAPAKPQDEAAAWQARMEAALKDYHGPEYVRSEVMIPMRDGVKLHTVILRPAGSDRSGPALPFLMTRTPYGVEGYTAMAVEAEKPELATSGYIFVFQDIRGRYASGGQFVMNRPVVAHGPSTMWTRRPIPTTPSTGC